MSRQSFMLRPLCPKRAAPDASKGCWSDHDGHQPPRETPPYPAVPVFGDPAAWLADTIARIPDHKITKVDDLLPWHWNGWRRFRRPTPEPSFQPRPEAGGHLRLSARFAQSPGAELSLRASQAGLPGAE